MLVPPGVAKPIVASARIPSGFGASPGKGKVVRFSRSIGREVDKWWWDVSPKTVPMEGNLRPCGRSGGGGGLDVLDAVKKDEVVGIPPSSMISGGSIC